jgi:CRISPR-associated protein Cmr3
MSTKHLTIKLAPLEKFYFGGETVFEGISSGKTSYIVSSRLYPQQSSLLGMLRFALLEQYENHQLATPEGIPAEYKDEAIALIGPNGFQLDVKGFDHRNDFGKIKSISPVFILKDNKPFFVAPIICQKTINKVKAVFEPGTFYNGQSTVEKLPVLQGFNYKKGFEGLLISADGETLKLKDVFIPNKITGIFKERTGGTNTKAFYKQTFYKFPNASYSFAFNVEIDESISIKDSFVSVGGDGSKFKMSVVKVAGSAFNYSAVESYSRPAAVAVSPAFIDPSWLKDCIFHVSEMLEFRFLQSSVQTRNYYSVGRDKDGVKRSTKFTLADRGSVFYFKDNESLEEFIKNSGIAVMQQIGYNHFETIK